MPGAGGRARRGRLLVGHAGRGRRGAVARCAQDFDRRQRRHLIGEACLSRARGLREEGGGEGEGDEAGRREVANAEGVDERLTRALVTSGARPDVAAT